jgi:hypothetical protein
MWTKGGDNKNYFSDAIWWEAHAKEYLIIELITTGIMIHYAHNSH